MDGKSEKEYTRLYDKSHKEYFRSYKVYFLVKKKKSYEVYFILLCFCNFFISNHLL